MKKLFSSVGLLSDVCLSRDVDFINNDKIVIDTGLEDICEFYKRELRRYVDKNLFFTSSPLAVAVGLCIAQKNLASRFNKFEINIISHSNICIVGDLSCGKNFDALNFAVRMGVDNLVVFYAKSDARLLNYFEKSGVNIASKSEVNFYDTSGITLVRLEDFFDSQEEDLNRLFKNAYQKAIIFGASREKIYKNDSVRFKKNYYDEYKLFKDFYDKKPTLSMDSRERLSGIDLGNVALNKISSDVLNVVGGTPNLIDKTHAFIVGGGEFPSNPIGTNINFVGFEDVMYEVCAGMSLHGGLNVFCADLLSRSYKLFGLDISFKGLFVFIEDDYDYLSLLRMDKHITTFNAGNASEIAFAFEYAFNTHKPTALVLSKELLSGSVANKEQIKNGAYIISDEKYPNGVLLASGKDVNLALEVKFILKPRGIDLIVLSVPCTNLLDDNLKIVNRFKMKSIFAFDRADTSYLERYIPKTGEVINVENETPENVAKKIYSLVKRNGERTDSLFDE